jgi:fibronectin type 3 domain-containing protein
MFVPVLSTVVQRTALVVAIAGVALGMMACDGGGTPDPPPVPSGIEALSQDGAVRLSWEDSSEAVVYNVYRDTSSMSGVSGTPVNGDTPIAQTTYRDESVENGTRYYYRVTAVGEVESEPSAEVSVRPFPSPPDRPE